MKSLAAYRKLYRESIEQPDRFWARTAKEELVWSTPFNKVHQWKDPWRNGSLVGA